MTLLQIARTKHQHLAVPMHTARCTNLATCGKPLDKLLKTYAPTGPPKLATSLEQLVVDNV